MYLSIDLSAFERIALKLFDANNAVSRVYSGVNRDLLKRIDTFLKENDFKVNQLRGIAVVMGEESFTSTRISTVVANAFGYVLNIPLAKFSAANLVDLPKLVAKINLEPRGQYLAAAYSREPNIGGTK